MKVLPVPQKFRFELVLNELVVSEGKDILTECALMLEAVAVAADLLAPK